VISPEDPAAYDDDLELRAEADAAARAAEAAQLEELVRADAAAVLDDDLEDDVNDNMHEPRWTFQETKNGRDVYRCTRCGATVKLRPGTPLPTALHED
jgi:hypothetical protein